jgi:WD40 repeat protein
VCKSYEGVAFDAAGRLMVVVTYRATSGKVVALPAQLRLAHGGRLLRTLSGTGSLANAANISPDGKLVATLDDHDRIGVWDSATGRRLTLFEGHAGRRTQWGPATVVFKFSPDGSLILSTDDSGLMLVWQARTGRVLNRIQGAARPPGAGYAEWGGAISPNDALFVTTADWDTGGTVYRVGQPKPLQQLVAGLFGMDDATFNHDGSLLASVSVQGVSLWDIHAQSPVLTIPGNFSARRWRSRPMTSRLQALVASELNRTTRSRASYPAASHTCSRSLTSARPRHSHQTSWRFTRAASPRAMNHDRRVRVDLRASTGSCARPDRIAS